MVCSLWLAYDGQDSLDVARIFSQRNGPYQQNTNSFNNKDKQSLALHAIQDDD